MTLSLPSIKTNPKPVPNELAEHWDRETPFVHPITALAAVAIMKSLEKGSKIYRHLNMIIVQDVSSYTFLGVNLMWFSRRFAYILGDDATFDTISYAEKARTIVDRWFSYNKQQLAEMKTQQNKSSHEIKKLEELISEQNKFLDLCMQGYDSLTRTYESNISTVKDANETRKRKLEEMKTNQVAETIILKDVEIQLKNMWGYDELKEFNATVGSHSQYLRESVKTPTALIDTINTRFQKSLDDYWDKRPLPIQ